MYSNINLAVRTGIAFDALDIDGPDGEASLAEFPHAADFDGLIAKTGRGRHFLVEPLGTYNRMKIRPGIDYRGDGGYIVVAPSLHVSGVRYSWLTKTVVGPAPDWLRDLLAPDPNRCRHVLGGGECGRSDPHKHRGGIVYPLSVGMLGLE